jgi:hypothetical protein
MSVEYKEEEKNEWIDFENEWIDIDSDKVFDIEFCQCLVDQRSHHSCSTIMHYCVCSIKNPFCCKSKQHDCACRGSINELIPLGITWNLGSKDNDWIPIFKDSSGTIVEQPNEVTKIYEPGWVIYVCRAKFHKCVCDYNNGELKKDCKHHTDE